MIYCVIAQARRVDEIGMSASLASAFTSLALLIYMKLVYKAKMMVKRTQLCQHGHSPGLHLRGFGLHLQGSHEETQEDNAYTNIG